MTASKGIRNLWTKDELKILRDAWTRGMTAKGIAAILLKHRTICSINMALYRNGMKLKGNPDRKPQISLYISIPTGTYEQLRSSASTQDIPVSKLCRTILQEEMRNLHDTRAGSSAHRKEYMRKYVREWRSRQRQKAPAE